MTGIDLIVAPAGLTLGTFAELAKGSPGIKRVQYTKLRGRTSSPFGSRSGVSAHLTEQFECTRRKHFSLPMAVESCSEHLRRHSPATGEDGPSIEQARRFHFRPAPL